MIKIWKDKKGMEFLKYQNKVYVLTDDVQKELSKITEVIERKI